MSSCYIIYTNTITCVIMCVCCVCGAWCDLVLAMLFKNQTSVNPLIKSLKIHIKNQHSNSHGTHGIQCVYCMYIYIHIFAYLKSHQI